MSRRHNVLVAKCLACKMSGCQNVSPSKCQSVEMLRCQKWVVCKMSGAEMSENHLGEGARAAVARRQQAGREEEARRREQTAHWLAHVQGRGVRRAGDVYV